MDYNADDLKELMEKYEKNFQKLIRANPTSKRRKYYLEREETLNKKGIEIRKSLRVWMEDPCPIRSASPCQKCSGFFRRILSRTVRHNKIPKNFAIIKSSTRSEKDEGFIKEGLKEIMSNFPKLIETNNFYKFKEWNSRHNFVTPKETPGNSWGVPKEALDKIRIRIRKEYIRLKNWDAENLTKNDYGRIGKATNRLLERTQGSADLVIKKMNVLNDRFAGKGLSWTLETLDKMWMDLSDKQESLPGYMKEL